ncbi:hypothetical protein [Streptomyces sp. NPDC056468]|uniref:hypothetical protein n=1 Tax=Streptomyces sp. NPDC056468 TaxID=3345830 RepID=UPI0036ACFFEB
MNSLTVSAHVTPDTETRVTVFDVTPDRSEPFISLRIAGQSVVVALLVSPDSAQALRALALAATEAAQVLEAMTRITPEVAA